jgi:Fe2+ or Zn2+ uptake regulation protein
VLANKTHPTADEVLSYARNKCPTVSRATVYNTLNLLVDKGLLGMQTLTGGAVVFDSNLKKHHHFIDDTTGEIIDIPWKDLQITGIEKLEGFSISEFQVVLRGTRGKR